MRIPSLDGRRLRLETLEARLPLDAGPLVLTEIMYHPPEPTDQEITAGFNDKDLFEFLEFQNTGDQPMSLDGMVLSQAVDFTFGAIVLGPGEYVVVVKDQAAFQFRYGAGTATIAGDYGDDNLRNGGERIKFDDAASVELFDFDYLDTWYPETDGEGYSLVLVDTASDPSTWGEKASWRPSWGSGGSPGDEDPGFGPTDLVINEVLSHTDLPEGDWIELYNTTGDDINIAGWFLSDDPGTPMKYRIGNDPSTRIVPAGGYVRFTQTQHFGVLAGDPGALEGFGLSEHGEEVVLSSGNGDTLTGFETSVSFGASEREVTFGRYTTSTNDVDFTAMASRTPGGPNSGPLIGSVVFSEIMYHPDAGGDEFIEIYNRSSQAVPLYDPDYPGNTWQIGEGIDTVSFPLWTTIPAYGRILVVLDPTNPIDFRAKYSVPSSVPIFGPYTGGLGNDNDALTLSRPGEPDSITGFVPYYVVDRVAYDDNSPWPTRADGKGSALIRSPMNSYPNDPANWEASSWGGTPGTANTPLDTTPPSVPTGLTATLVESREVDLQWNTSNDPETAIKEYRIYRNGEYLDDSPDTAFSDNDVDPEQSYSYRVTAVNLDGAESALSTPPLNVVTPRESAVVEARFVFYNDSMHDGNGPAVGGADDDAIADDKEPLLPGDPKATFANYTSYSRGINGIMVDITRLAGTPGVGDFEFRIGNNNNPAGWQVFGDGPGEPQPSITVRSNDGQDGSDRVVLTWPDGAIANTWLQVTVKATANTGLDQPDVFYFGNAIGEIGNSANNAMVSSADEIAIRHHPQIFTPAAVDNPYDINRDGMVSSLDQVLARHNISVVDALALITVPAPAPPLPAPAASDAVFEQTADRDPTSAAAMFVDPLGFIDFEQLLADDSPSESESGLEEGVDAVLGTMLP